MKSVYRFGGMPAEHTSSQTAYVFHGKVDQALGDWFIILNVETAIWFGHVT